MMLDMGCEEEQKPALLARLSGRLTGEKYLKMLQNHLLLHALLRSIRACLLSLGVGWAESFKEQA